MSKTLQSIRGMNDVLPEEIPYWQHIEKSIRQTVGAYGYQEIRTPIVEKTALFKRSIGEVTDIVEKEMYTFEDRNGDSLSLRPEGTASCVRAGLQHGLLYNQIQRLWYMGPMFRHERPQKCRLRQFYQCGVEAFGMPGPEIDVELILLSAQLWRVLGLDKVIHLQINSLGNLASRAQYRQALVTYLQQYTELLDEDCQRRLHTNPLRILDSKNPALAEILAEAPQLIDYLDVNSAQQFSAVQTLLDKVGVPYKVNPHIVRGLDYYSDIVYEWVTEDLGAQGTVCAGGRYDGLIEQLSGRSGHAVGFALGVERVVTLLSTQYETQKFVQPPHAYLIMVGEQARLRGMLIANNLRKSLPNLRLIMNAGGGSFKNQFKRADKAGAQLAFVIGDDELAQQVVTVKHLREDKPQRTLPEVDLLAFCCKQFLL